MRTDPTAHVVIRDRGVVACLHCGASLDPQLPQPTSVAVAVWRAFTKAHRDCAPPAEPSK